MGKGFQRTNIFFLLLQILDMKQLLLCKVITLNHFLKNFNYKGNILVNNNKLTYISAMKPLTLNASHTKRKLTERINEKCV